MEYEFDRATDLGGEPSIADMTAKSIKLLEAASRRGSDGYFLMVEGGRIDHAPPRGQRVPRPDRHAGARRGDRRRRSAGRSARDAHHRHRRPQPRVQHRRLPAASAAGIAVPASISSRAGYARPPRHAATAFFDVVYDLDQSTGHVSGVDATATACPTRCSAISTVRDTAGAAHAIPRTIRSRARRRDPERPVAPAYFQEVGGADAGPRRTAREDVAIYAIGAGATQVARHGEEHLHLPRHETGARPEVANRHAGAGRPNRLLPLLCQGLHHASTDSHSRDYPWIPLAPSRRVRAGATATGEPGGGDTGTSGTGRPAATAAGSRHLRPAASSRSPSRSASSNSQRQAGPAQPNRPCRAPGTVCT